MPQLSTAAKKRLAQASGDCVLQRMHYAAYTTEVQWRIAEYAEWVANKCAKSIMFQK